MIEGTRPLLLGSASPRRREILTALGIPLVIRPVDLDESIRAGEATADYLDRVVLAKLAAVISADVGEVGSGRASGDVGAVLAADTIVVLDGAILGKPRDDAAARAMIEALSGREHQVWTRFAIAPPPELRGAIGDRSAGSIAAHVETVRTNVWFRDLTSDEIRGYVATGEGRDKAGAYAIQGIGAFAVSRIEGSYSNVVGLPACEVVAALRGAGLLARFPFAPAAGS